MKRVSKKEKIETKPNNEITKRCVRILIHQRGFSHPDNGNEGNEFILILKEKQCWIAVLRSKNVPAIAENNDLEQGSPAQCHSWLRWGCKVERIQLDWWWLKLLLILLLDLIDSLLLCVFLSMSTSNAKGEKRRHFLDRFLLYSCTSQNILPNEKRNKIPVNVEILHGLK